jgi:hypothetical protein
VTEHWPHDASLPPLRAPKGSHPTSAPARRAPLETHLKQLEANFDLRARSQRASLTLQKSTEYKPRGSVGFCGVASRLAQR